MNKYNDLVGELNEEDLSVGINRYKDISEEQELFNEWGITEILHLSSDKVIFTDGEDVITIAYDGTHWACMALKTITGNIKAALNNEVLNSLLEATIKLKSREIIGDCLRIMRIACDISNPINREIALLYKQLQQFQSIEA